MILIVGYFKLFDKLKRWSKANSLSIIKSIAIFRVEGPSLLCLAMKDETPKYGTDASSLFIYYLTL